MSLVSGILLAAGLSARFGSPKALAPLLGTTVIEHLQQVLLASRLAEIVVVLGAHEDRIKPLLLKHKRIKVVHNKDYNLGQTVSFQAGLKQADTRAGGFLLLPVDYPLIRAATIDHLIRIFEERQPTILIPAFNGRKGHPPVFAAALKPELLGLSRDTGVNTVIHRHEPETLLEPVTDGGVIKTFNTPEEFAKIKTREVI